MSEIVIPASAAGPPAAGNPEKTSILLDTGSRLRLVRYGGNRFHRWDRYGTSPALAGLIRHKTVAFIFLSDEPALRNHPTYGGVAFQLSGP